jgi:hypothetical protein
MILNNFLNAGDAVVPAGKTLVYLTMNTYDRQNLSGAKWVLTATGKSYTVTADATGRGEALVDSGLTYTATLTHSGNYYNDDPQKFVAESRNTVMVYFDLFSPSQVTTVVQVRADFNSTVTATSGTDTMTQVTDASGIAEFTGLNTGTTWTFSANGASKTVTIEHLFTSVRLLDIYGVKIEIANSSPSDAVTYIDDAVGMTPASGHNLGSWATCPLFTGIKPVMKNGSTWTDLDKTNLTKTASGKSVNASGTDYDFFTEVPTWWLSITSDGTCQYIRFANMQVDSTFQKLASMWNGKDVGMFHIGCCHAFHQDDKLYSLFNTLPTTSISTAQFLTYAQNRGTGYDKEMWHQRTYLNALLVLAYKTLDGQSAIGAGYTGGSSKTSESITTFDNNFGIAGSASLTEHMAWLWINDWWGNVFTFIGGAKTDSSCRLMTLDNGAADNIDGTGYTTHNTTPTSARNGYVSQMDCGSTAIGFFPKTCSGSSTAFWCDDGVVIASFFPYVGGYYSGGARAGPFYAYFAYSSSGTYSSVGSRLSYRAGRA